MMMAAMAMAMAAERGGDVKQIENRASTRTTHCFKLIRPGYIRTVDNLQTKRFDAT